jgi:hypothetical protein
MSEKEQQERRVNMSESNQLTVREHSGEVAVYQKMADPLAAAQQMGEWIAKSGMFGCTRTEQGQVLALACLTENKTPFQILRTYHLMDDGKLAKKALAILAEFRAKGGKHKWIKSGDDGVEAELWLSFEGQTTTTKFSLEDAKRQGLIHQDPAKFARSNWSKTPGNMMRARCISNGVAMLAPEILAGGDDMDESSYAPVAAPSLFPVATAGTEAAAAGAKEWSSVLKPEPAGKVVDAEVVPEGEEDFHPVPEAQRKVKDEPKPEPKPKPAPPPKPETPPPAATLPVKRVQELQEAIGESNAEAALTWLVGKKWIPEGGNLSHLSENRAARIIAKPDEFVGFVNAKAAK